MSGMSLVLNGRPWRMSFVLSRSLTCKIFPCFQIQAFFFFKQKTAYEVGLGIPAEPLFRSEMQQQDNHEYPFLYQRQTCHQVQPNQATYQKRQKCQPATYLQEVLYQL